MTLRSLANTMLWVVLPLCTVAVGVYFALATLDTSPDVVYALIPLAILTCLYCVGLVIAVNRLRDRVGLLVGEKKSSRRIERDLATKYEDLQNQIELLTAMRNVSHVVNDAVEFHTILEEVMRIVADLTGALEITIFLLGEDSRKLLPAAHRTGDVIVFDEDIKRLRIDRRNVYQALQYQTIFRYRHGNHINFTIPLIADQESLGVLSAVVPLSGEVEEVAASMEHCEATLVSLAKHISLAIKTPLLYNRAVIDSLTRLYTKRHFHLQLSNYFNASRRLEKPMALIMMDIDDFKPVNDNYGHLTGDKILSEIATLILNTIRQYDSAYRYGGEELSLLLPESELTDALLVAERVRTKIEKHEFIGLDNQKLRVTASLGVADFQPDLADPKTMIARADAALYFAKQHGKNRTCYFSQGELCLIKNSGSVAGKAQ